MKYILGTLLVAFASGEAAAQTSICKELTINGLFNASDLSRDSEQYDLLRKEYCDTYQSTKGESQKSDASIEASYGGIGGSASKSDTVRKNEAFFKQLCTSSLGEFQLNEKLRSSVRQASHDLAALFVECVKSTQYGFASYFTAPSYDTFTVHMRHRQTTPASLDIENFFVSPASANVKCVPPEVMNATEKNPYKTPQQDYYSVSCTKNPEESVNVTLLVAQAGQAVQASIPGTKDKMGELEARVEKLNAVIDKGLQGVKRIETGMKLCPGSNFPTPGGYQERASWTVEFKESFTESPTVTAAIAQIERTTNASLNNAGQATVAEAWKVHVRNVTPSKAEVVLDSGYTNVSLSQCAVQWIAVGR